MGRGQPASMQGHEQRAALELGSLSPVTAVQYFISAHPL